MNNLGFGMMRLPVKKGPEDFDYEELNKMVDAFLDAGFTYFDTSYVYHNGKSQEAVRKSLVERHPRKSFTIATKFPTFMNMPEEKVDDVFESQLRDVGVDYFDYYLLHTVKTIDYDGVDGKGGIIKSTHLFEHEKKWKDEGKIRQLGFSFHDSPKLLERILNEHPEVDFVQIALNPVDWDSEFVMAKENYEVIRRHGKGVVVMETLKGGGMSHMPAEAEKILKNASPDLSVSSWSLRFAEGLDGVIAALSGMSNLEQMEDNIHTSLELGPLSDSEKETLFRAVDAYREAGVFPPSEIDKYRSITWHGVPLTGILESYSICQLQPDPHFTDDQNYIRQYLASESHITLEETEKNHFRLSDGTIAEGKVAQAIKWVKDAAF